MSHECRLNFVTTVYGEIRNCGLIHLVPDIESMINARKNPIDTVIVAEDNPSVINKKPALHICLLTVTRFNVDAIKECQVFEDALSTSVQTVTCDTNYDECSR